MISIIANNKILEYLNSKPSAKIPLLIWLKENHINRWNSRGGEFDFNSCQLGASKYYIDLKIRPSLEIAYITWLGTREDRDRELQKRRAEHQELVI